MTPETSALTRQYDLLKRQYDELVVTIASGNIIEAAKCVTRQWEERDKLMDELEREG